MNTKEAQLNAVLAKAIGGALIQDEGVALRIRCVGYPESSKHYADAVVVAATSLTLSIDGTADSTVGASGVLLFATYTTLGTLVDAINLSANWEAEIVAGLRSDATDGSQLLARSTSTFRMSEEKSLYWDSSLHLSLDFLLESNLPFETVSKADSKKSQARSQHRVGFQRALCKDDNSGDALTVKVYEVKPDKATAWKTLLNEAVTDATEKDTGAQYGTARFHSDFGNSLLVRFAGATTFSDTTCYLKVEGTRV